MQLLRGLALTDANTTSSVPERTMRAYHPHRIFIDDELVKGEDGHVYEAKTGKQKTDPATFLGTNAFGSSTVSWTAHGFAPGTPVMITQAGGLPANHRIGQVYYVLADPVDPTNKFNLAATPGGSPIASGVSSGPMTIRGNTVGHALSNPTYFNDLGEEPDPPAYDAGEIVVKGERRMSPAEHLIYAAVAGAAIAGQGAGFISNASPGAVAWANHGGSDGWGLIFETAGTLPAPLQPGQIYYLVDVAAHTFGLAATPGGAAIDTTTDGSGLHGARIGPVGAALGDIEAFAEVGPNNRWAALDAIAETRSQAQGLMRWVFDPAPVDGLILTDLEGVDLALEVTLSVGGIQQWTSGVIDLDLSAFANWLEAWRGLFLNQDKIALNLIPYYPTGVLTVELTGTGLIKAGVVMPGTLLTFADDEFGGTRYGSELDAVVYGDFEPNEYGITRPNIRRLLDRGTYEVVFPRTRKPMVKRALDERLGQPTGFIPSTLDEDSPDIIVGLLKARRITNEGPDHCVARIEALEF